MNETKKTALAWLGIGVVLFAAACGWGIFVPPAVPAAGAGAVPASVAQAIVSGVAARVPEFVIKVLCIVVLAQIAIQSVKRLAGVEDLDQLIDKFQADDDNDSAAIIGAGMIVAIAWVVCTLPFANWQCYGVFLLAKIGFWMGTSVVCAGLLLKIFGFNGFGRIESAIRTQGTEAAAVCIAGGTMVAAFIATVV